MKIKYAIGDSVLVQHKKSYVQGTIEKILISEGDTRFKDDIKYVIRSDRKPVTKFDLKPVKLYAPNPEEPDESPYTVEVTRYKEVKRIQKFPREILMEDGKEKWFDEGCVYRNMEHLIRSLDNKRNLPKQLR